MPNRSLRRLFRRVVERVSFAHRHVDWSDKLVTAEQVRYVRGLGHLYDRIHDVPGHLIELGVGRGRNAVILGTLVREAGQDAFRRYYGFDTFSGYPEDVRRREPHLDGGAHRDTSLSFVEEIRDRNDLGRLCRFVAGDFRRTIPALLASGDDELQGFAPGALRVALVYVDCNAREPAEAALALLHPHLSDGAVIAVDERRQGGELQALEHFCAEHGLTLRAGESGIVSAWTHFHRREDA